MKARNPKNTVAETNPMFDVLRASNVAATVFPGFLAFV